MDITMSDFKNVWEGGREKTSKDISDVWTLLLDICRSKYTDPTWAADGETWLTKCE